MSQINYHKFPIRTSDPDQVKRFLWRAFGVVIPDVRVCPDHQSPWEALWDAFTAERASCAVWVARRGGGKSFTIACLGQLLSILLRASVNILGGSGEQAKRVHDHMQELWKKPAAPRYLLQSDPTKRETTLKNGSKIQALMASSASVRGAHVERLLLDEVDEMELEILDASMGQTMSSKHVKAHTVFSSTYHRPDGVMKEVLRRADKNGWPVFRWCSKEIQEPHGWLPKEEEDRKRGEVTERMYNIEYLLQEPTAIGRVIDRESVEKTFTGDMIHDEIGEYYEFEPPHEDGLYVHGTDWGRKRDCSAIVTFRVDCVPARLIAYERRHREPWPKIIARHDKRVERFVGESIADGTGLGDVIDFYCTQPVEALIINARSRKELLSRYMVAIENGEVSLPRIKSLYLSHRDFNAKMLDGAEHCPDEFIACALAWKAAIHSDTGVTV